MEVETVNNHLESPLMSSLEAIQSSALQQQSDKVAIDNGESRLLQQSYNFVDNSPISGNSDIDKELQQLNLNNMINNCSINLPLEVNNKSFGSLSGTSSTSTAGVITDVESCGDNKFRTANASINVTLGNTSCPTSILMVQTAAAPSNSQSKKRLSNNRTPTRKARRIKFYRNGDRFYPGITIPVSNERYRSFESLFEDLTRLLEENVKIPGAVRTIYTMCGKKISSLEELEDGQSYVCSCNNENFKKIEYNTSSQPLANLALSGKASNRLSKFYRPTSPLKNGGGSGGGCGGGGGGGTSGMVNSTSNGYANSVCSMSNSAGANISITLTATTASLPTNTSNGNSTAKYTERRDNVVHPRIVTLIRNGTKPRKVMRLLLNKRNSPSFEHVLTAITQKVRLDTGYVRKVFTLSGTPVTQLADFFGEDDVFFACGSERVNNPDDFKLEADEQKALQSIRKVLRTTGVSCQGPKPKMPIKSTKTYDEEEANLLNDSGINANDLPQLIRERYVLGKIIGDGNFAVVLKIRDRQTGLPYALKIIDKSKCKGKEHYIDAEVRVMKKLCHQHIISLIMDVDQMANMYLVLEYVSGGDLFDAIIRATRFSEDQARVMLRHLASATSYLHSMSIVHRDIKPENLLVELDDKGQVIVLKLADFGLACEVTEPLYAVCGTPTYVAPEILLETGYGLKIDVWAAGVILYILLCGFPPFVSPDSQQEPLFDAIISGVYEFPEPYWNDISDDVRDLINNMLQSDPDIRFTSEDILDHFWTLNSSSSSRSSNDLNNSICRQTAI